MADPTGPHIPWTVPAESLDRDTQLRIIALQAAALAYSGVTDGHQRPPLTREATDLLTFLRSGR